MLLGFSPDPVTTDLYGSDYMRILDVKGLQVFSRFYAFLRNYHFWHNSCNTFRNKFFT